VGPRAGTGHAAVMSGVGHGMQVLTTTVRYGLKSMAVARARKLPACTMQKHCVCSVSCAFCEQTS
jgi:hypothetical protein